MSMARLNVPASPVENEAGRLPIRGMPDGLDARTAAVDSGCLCSVLYQDLHKLDETARSVEIDRGAGHSESGLQILKDWDNRDCSWVRARRPLISAEENFASIGRAPQSPPPTRASLIYGRDACWASVEPVEFGSWLLRQDDG
jgi:hypothetical protein